jgi:hypothetical protein
VFKVFAFCLAAALSGIGGALFVLQVGFISPSLVGIVPSIEMVIFAAVGGRQSLLRRGLRHTAGEHRQEPVLRDLPAALAVRHGRPVHRGGRALSRMASRRLGT